MGDTKQNILNTARMLFNTTGYSQVTIRMIALELKMSSGNLNYHFRKREDILEALYFEMVEAFDNRVSELENQTITLAHMHTQIQQSMHRMIDYRFFWTDLYNLLNLNSNIQTHFETVRADRMKGYKFVFESLISQKLMQPASFPHEHQFLSERMLHISNTWLYASSLYAQQKEAHDPVDSASFQLLSMLYPYLTKAGKADFRKAVPAYLV